MQVEKLKERKLKYEGTLNTGRLGIYLHEDKKCDNCSKGEIEVMRNYPTNETDFIYLCLPCSKLNICTQCETKPTKGGNYCSFCDD